MLIGRAGEKGTSASASRGYQRARVGASLMATSDEPGMLIESKLRAMTSQTIQHDLPCLGCGYNLRGLRGEGQCPECGLPVAESIAGDGLVVGTTRRLGRLRRGAGLGVVYVV